MGCAVRPEARTGRVPIPRRKQREVQPESGSRRPSEALIEVIYAALLSLGADPAGGRAPGEIWERVVEGVDSRLGGQPGGGPPRHRGGASPSAEPSDAVSEETDFGDASAFAHAEVAELPDDFEESDSLLGFVKKSAGGGPAPAGPAPREPDRARSARSEKARPPAPREVPADAGDEDFLEIRDAAPGRALERETSALRALNDRLRKRIGELEGELRSSREAGPAAGGDAASTYLQAFGVADPPSGPSVENEVGRELNLIARYFEKTRGNLAYLFGENGFNVPVTIPALADVIAADLRSGEGLDRHLDTLRAYWKGIFREIWINLRPWCDDLARRLDPERIVSESRRMKEEPWEVYSDLARRLDLYDSLLGMLRLKIRNHLEHISPP